MPTKTRMHMKENVWLVKSHRDIPKTKELSAQKNVRRFLEEQEYATLLTEDMVSQSIMHPDNSDIETQARFNFYSSALRALAFLDGFVSVVSIKIELSEDGGTIIHPEKEWCKIFLASGEFVLGFSRDTRYSNRSFYDLAGWLEEDWETNAEEKWKKVAGEDWEKIAGEDWRKDAVMAGIKKYSTIEAWRNFFLKQIQNKADSLKNKASGLQHEVHSLKAEAGQIQILLSRL